MKKASASANAKRSPNYDRIANRYDALMAVAEPFNSKHRKELLKHTNGTVLEVGVSTGKAFKDYPEKTTIVGIDVSLKMLKKAIDKKANTNDVSLIQADVGHLPFQNEVYPSIFSSWLFCAVAKPVEGLEEMCRVAKTGGELLLLEHVKSCNRLVGGTLKKLNPFLSKVDDFEADTLKNLQIAGWSLAREKNVIGA